MEITLASLIIKDFSATIELFYYFRSFNKENHLILDRPWIKEDKCFANSLHWKQTWIVVQSSSNEREKFCQLLWKNKFELRRFQEETIDHLRKNCWPKKIPKRMIKDMNNSKENSNADPHYLWLIRFFTMTQKYILEIIQEIWSVDSPVHPRCNTAKNLFLKIKVNKSLRHYRRHGLPIHLKEVFLVFLPY